MICIEKRIQNEMISSSLLHFTDFKSLKLIFGDTGLRCSYCNEDISAVHPNHTNLAIPMVSFCDIPLKDVLRKHVRRYGYYAIGFKKRWALRKGIKPVQYHHSTKDERFNRETHLRQLSSYKESVLKNFQVAARILKETDDEMADWINGTLGRLANVQKWEQEFLTNYMIWTKQYYTKKENNYIDREWRFVPDHHERYFDRASLKELNAKYHGGDPHYLRFSISDIEHIVLKKKEDFASLELFLQKQGWSTASISSIALVTSNLTSIKTDY